jgi:hypothetical protein
MYDIAVHLFLKITIFKLLYRKNSLKESISRRPSSRWEVSLAPGSYHAYGRIIKLTNSVFEEDQDLEAAII